MKKVLLSLMAASLVFTACEDDFTEKDLLEAQQSAPYTVRITDATADQFSEAYAVEGVTVTITQGGETYTATTNADGFALFAQVKLGTFYYSIEGDKYYSTMGQGSITQAGNAGSLAINVIPKEAENFATVEGVIQIEDWSGVIDTLKSGAIEFSYNENTQPIVATIDAEGKYSVRLPAGSKGSISYRISASESFITLPYDQNQDGVIDAGEEGEFRFISSNIDVISGKVLEEYNLSYYLN